MSSEGNIHTSSRRADGKNRLKETWQVQYSKFARAWFFVLSTRHSHGSTTSLQDKFFEASTGTEGLAENHLFSNLKGFNHICTTASTSSSPAAVATLMLRPQNVYRIDNHFSSPHSTLKQIKYGLIKFIVCLVQNSPP